MFFHCYKNVARLELLPLATGVSRPKKEVTMVLLTTSSHDSVESRPTLREKLAAVAGTGAVAVAAVSGSPSEVHADLVMSTTAPISPPSSDGSNFWDVDGDGTGDFRLRNARGSTTFISDTYTSTFQTSWQSAFFDDVNGGRLVMPVGDDTWAEQGGIAKLPFNFQIGPGLAAAYKFHLNPQSDNTIRTAAYASPSVGYDAEAGGWSLGETGFFGFKFTKGSDTHYGWGEMTISSRLPGTYGGDLGFIINEAWYENSAGASVGVGAIPEASQVAGHSLLALGAAGLAIWRRRKESVDAVVE